MLPQTTKNRRAAVFTFATKRWYSRSEGRQGKAQTATGLAPGEDLQRGHAGPQQRRSALRELLAPACGMQADLLALDLARVARDEAGLAQRGLERGVVVDQRARDAVAHCAGLAGLAAASHVDRDVEALDMVGQHQRLLGDHDRSLAAEEFGDVAAVDRDLAAALFQKHTGDARFAPAGAVVPFTNHPWLLRLPAPWAAGRCADARRRRTPSA